MGVIRTVREMMQPTKRGIYIVRLAQNIADIKEICGPLSILLRIVTAVESHTSGVVQDHRQCAAYKFEACRRTAGSGVAFVNNDFLM